MCVSIDVQCETYVRSNSNQHLVNIPSSNAAEALNLLAEQTEALLIFPYDIAESRTAKAVSGNYSIKEALDLILNDSGLIAEISDRGVIRVRIENNVEMTNKKRNGMKTQKTLLASIFALMFTSAQGAEKLVKTDEVNNEIEVIEVRGIRASQKANLNAKRFSDNIVDVVNSEDIGKFPDTNLAESLQRISGVSIDRAKGEGRKISIRGLGPDLVNVTLNGRTVVSANPGQNLNTDQGTIGRSFNFDVLQSELVSGLEVFKSSSASLLEGGLAGSVDVKTSRPLDVGKQIMTASISAAYDDFADSVDPKIAFLYNDVFSDETIGFSLGLAYSDRALREDRADGISYAERDFNINGETITSIAAGNLRAFHFDDQRERLNVTSAFQYSINDNLLLSIDALYANFDNTQNLSDLPLRQRAGGGSGAYTAMTVTPSGIADSYTVTNGVRPRLDRIRSEGSENLGVYGLNLQWDGDDLTVIFDTSYSNAKYNSDLVRFGFDATTSSSIDVKLNSLVPDISLDADLQNPSLYALNVAYNDATTVDDTEIQAKLEGTYTLESDFLSSIQVGIRFAKRDKDLYKTRIQAGAAFGGTLLSDVPGDSLVQFPVNDFLDSFSGNFPRSWVEPDIQVAYDHFFVERANELLPSAYQDPTITSLTENTAAIFAQANFFNDTYLPIRGNFGVRVVKTDLDSGGAVRNVEGIDQLDATVTYAPAQYVTVDNSYTDILPSFNISMDITENLIARLAIAKTMSRPRVEDLSPATLAVNPSILLVKEGNASLEPFRANQVDTNLEWYFDEESVLSVGLFYKDIESFIYTGVELEPLVVDGEDVIDPLTNSVMNLQHDRPINGDGGSVWGYELNLQHSFDSGFGTAINYTFVDTDAEFTNTITGDVFGVPGLSEDSFNATVYYETEKWSARVSYNYRSEFLSKVAGVGSNPIFTKEYGQYDISTSYNVNDDIVLRFDAINLTGEVTEKYAISPELLRDYAQTGRRYQLSVSASF